MKVESRTFWLEGLNYNNDFRWLLNGATWPEFFTVIDTQIDWIKKREELWNGLDSCPQNQQTQMSQSE